MNYGDKHFGVPVFDYFPWNKYSTGQLNIVPDLSKYFRLYQSVITDDIVSVWYYSNGYPMTGGGFSRSDIMIVHSMEEELQIGRNRYSVENWIDVEKIRLMEHLGTRSLANRHLNYLDKYQQFIDVIEDVEDSNSEFNYEADFDFSILQDLINHGKVTKDMFNLNDNYVVEFIRNYNGDTEFYKSLKSYLNFNNLLTYKQIKAVINKPNYELFGIDPTTLGLFIKRDSISKLLLPRLKNMGFKINKSNDGTLIY